jgi:hypothetical protein
MTADEIRRVKCAIAEALDNGMNGLFIAHAQVSAQLEIAAQLAELNAKTPSLHQRYVLAAMMNDSVEMDGMAAAAERYSGLADVILEQQKREKAKKGHDAH